MVDTFGFEGKAYKLAILHFKFYRTAMSTFTYPSGDGFEASIGADGYVIISQQTMLDDDARVITLNRAEAISLIEQLQKFVDETRIPVA